MVQGWNWQRLHMANETVKVTRSIFVLAIVVAVISTTACSQRPQPIEGLWAVPIHTAAPPTPTPTAKPTPLPKTEPTIVITSETAVAEPDDEALFILNVIVEDRYGYLQEAMLTITWPDTPLPFVVGPTADIKIPILASSPPFLLKVEKEGYITVYQPFDVTINADMQYEFTVTILASGDPA